MKRYKIYHLVALLLAANASAETINNKVKILGGTDGTAIGNVGDALKVTGTFSIGGSVTVTQGTSPWVTSISNFPASFGATQVGTWTVQQGTPPWSVSQSGAWTTGRTWTLLNTTDSVNVGNFPASFSVTQGTSPWVVSGSVSVSNFPASFSVTQGTSPWVVSGTVTSNIGTTGGLALDSTLSSFSAKFNSLGQKTMANSAPIVIASDQSAIPVTGTFFQTIQPVSQSGTWTTGRTWTLSSGTDSVAAVQSGTWTVQQGTPPWSVSQSGSWTVTSNQGTSPWVDNISQFGGNAVVTGTGASGLGIPRVTVSNDSNILATQSGTWTTGRTWALASGTDSVSAAQSGTWTVQQGGAPWSVSQSGTWNINNISGTISLPTGAATETSLAKLTQTQGSTTSGQSGPLVLGAVTTNSPTYTTAQSNPLSLGIHGGLRTLNVGGDTAQLVRNDYSTTNVTTAAYVQLVASTTVEINRLHIFDSSGQDFVLATGAAASEVDQIQIPPGGWDQPIQLYIPSGTRISIKSKSATASSGILLITGLK